MPHRFQLTTTVPKNEADYRVRIYGYPANTSPSLLNDTTLRYGSMESHMDELRVWKQNAPVEFDHELVLDIGPVKTEKESEFAIGQPSIDMLRVDLAPNKAFRHIVQAALEFDTEVWIEVVRIAHVVDLPAMQSGDFLAPREERLYFWGMLDRKEFKDKVIGQDLKGESTSRVVRNVEPYNGTLSMAFIPGMKVRYMLPVKTWLDAVAGTTDASIRASELLRTLIEYISPTSLVAITDDTFKHDALGDVATSRNRCAVSLPCVEANTNTPVNLAKIWCKRFISGVTTTLFKDAGEDTPEGSLYKFKDAGEALMLLTKEFFQFPQFELPTLAEAALNPKGNTFTNRRGNWKGCTRVVLLHIESDPPEVEIDADQDSIDIVHAATWVSTAKIDQPGPDALEPKWGSILGWAVNGLSINYKTLFRFLGTMGSPPVDTASAFDLQYGDSLGSLVDLEQVDFLTQGGTFTCNNWGWAHAFVNVTLWGRMRTQITLTSDGNGIETWRNNVTRNFRLKDWGEFPLMRTARLLLGSMVTEKSFWLLSLERSTGSETDAGLSKMMLLSKEDFLTIPDDRFSVSLPPAPPPPPPPPDRPPHVTITTPTAGAVTGNVSIVGTADDDYGVVLLKLYVDGAFMDVKSVSGVTLGYTFTWDARPPVAAGTHVIKVVAEDTSHQTASASVSVTV